MDTSVYDTEIAMLDAELASLTAKIEKLIAANSANAMSQDAYRKKYADFEARFNLVQKRRDDLDVQKRKRVAQAHDMKVFIGMLQANEHAPMTFDGEQWYLLVDHVTVSTDYTLTFHLRNGGEMTDRV